MSVQPSILIVDDEQGILDTLRILLKNEGFDVTTAQGGKAGLEQVKAAAPDLVLPDIKMPGVTGIDVLAAAKDQDPETPVILMTAQASLQTAIQAVNQGAFHYVPKPFSNDEIVALCRRAAEVRRLKAENKQLKQEIRRRERSGLVKPLGKSRLFQDVLRLAEQVAPTESTVLIQGESGTGKEVIARYIHERSARTEGPFLSLNCGALPESLLESELFGHVKGSFTGAVRDKQGLFAAARGGTFFLDEIGEMSPATQVKLLRVLQEREAIPVGGTEPIPVDVRVVAATNRDLEDDIKRGRFRTDLYYRLNVIAIHLPPLRDRRDDIEIFVTAFLERIAQEHGEAPQRLDADALEAIMAYDWPGNVRELENALERAGVLTKGGTIGLAAMPVKITEHRAEPLLAERPLVNPTLDVIERAYITWVLESEGGNKTRAAIRAAISRATGDVVVIQDADLEYDPVDLPTLMQPILDGKADAVYGSRFQGGPHRVLYFWHSVGNRFLTLLSNMFTNLNLTDMETCYKLVRADLLKRLPLTANRFGFEVEITARLAQAGARIWELPISYSGRTYAEGKKITWRDGLAALFHILRYNLFPPAGGGRRR